MNKNRKLRLCFVCPRYRTDHAGGAEILTEKLAKKLVSDGHHVEVFTTCAQDHYTWKNYYRPGTFSDNDVKVTRFRVDEDRNVVRFLQIQKKIDFGQDLTRDEELAWISGSVHSSSLYKEIEKRRNAFDWFVFAPYLFGISYKGSLLFPEKSLLIPCLHDEPFAYLSIFREMFASVKGILFNSVPEKKLAEKIYEINEEKCGLVGMGFDVHDYTGIDTKRFREKYGLAGKPYILYAGRREQGKNTPLLIEYVQGYNSNHDKKVCLVLIGTGEVHIPPEAEHFILDLGFLSVEEKNSAYREADIFCQPSVNESLSIVIMESWLAGTPVLVNGKCEVTKYHCKTSNGGIYFNNFYEFDECVSLLIDNKELGKKLAENGKNYVLNHYSWDKVIRSFEELLSELS